MDAEGVVNISSDEDWESSVEFPEPNETLSNLLPLPPFNSFLEDHLTELDRKKKFYKISKRFSAIYGCFVEKTHREYHSIRVLCMDYEEKFDDLDITVLLPVAELADATNCCFVKGVIFNSTMTLKKIIVTIQSDKLPEELRQNLGPINFEELPLHYRLMVEHPERPLTDYLTVVDDFGVEEAEVLFRELGIDPEFLTMPGTKILSENDYVSAIKQAQEAELFKMYREKGQGFIEAKDYKKAEEAFKVALKYNLDETNLRETTLELAGAFFEQENYEKAAETYLKAYRLNESDEETRDKLVKTIKKLVKTKSAAIEDKIKYAMVLSDMQPEVRETSYIVVKLFLEAYYIALDGLVWLNNYCAAPASNGEEPVAIRVTSVEPAVNTAVPAFSNEEENVEVNADDNVTEVVAICASVASPPPLTTAAKRSREDTHERMLPIEKIRAAAKIKKCRHPKETAAVKHRPCKHKDPRRRRSSNVDVVVVNDEEHSSSEAADSTDSDDDWCARKKKKRFPFKEDGKLSFKTKKQRQVLKSSSVATMKRKISSHHVHKSSKTVPSNFHKLGGRCADRSSSCSRGCSPPTSRKRSSSSSSSSSSTESRSSSGGKKRGRASSTMDPSEMFMSAVPYPMSRYYGGPICMMKPPQYNHHHHVSPHHESSPRSYRRQRRRSGSHSSPGEAYSRSPSPEVRRRHRGQDDEVTSCARDRRKESRSRVRRSDPSDVRMRRSTPVSGHRIRSRANSVVSERPPDRRRCKDRHGSRCSVAKCHCSRRHRSRCSSGSHSSDS